MCCTRACTYVRVPNACVHVCVCMCACVMRVRVLCACVTNIIYVSVFAYISQRIRQVK